ncbi:hypothetical protein EE612_000083 [Oryza sativa]|nr:hypothetical protein EE612_000083 [Oryza sativa]
MLFKLLRLPIAAGIGPKNPGLLIYKLFKFVRLPIEDGIELYVLQFDISKLCKSTRSPIADIIGLVRLQPNNLKLLKFLKLLMDEGFVLEKSNSDSIKHVKFLWAPIHDNKLDPESPNNSELRSSRWHKDQIKPNDVRKSLEINFPSRPNSFSILKLLEEIGLA